MTASLRILPSKADSNTWESFTRSELKLQSVHQESPRSDIFKKRATKPLLKQKHLTWAKEKKDWTVAQWSKVLFSDESTFAFNLEIKLPESGGRVERRRIHVAWSPVWSFHSQWRFGLRCYLLVLVHCVSEVHSQRSHLPGNFRALHASFCWQALWEMLISFSSRTWHLPTLPKVPKAGSMAMVLLCLIGQQTRLTWTPWRIYGVLSRGRWETPDTQQSRWPEGRYQSNVGFITPEQCYRLIASMHATLMQ